MVLLASSFDKSNYLRAEDVPTPKKFRIKSVTVQSIRNDNKGEEEQLVVWFTNDKRGVVLNKTNNRTLRGAFGDDVAGWKDKIVILFQTMVDFKGKSVPGLRVHIPAPKQPTAGGNGHTAAVPPSTQSSQLVQQQLDEFGQEQSSEKPAGLSADLDDEIPF